MYVVGVGGGWLEIGVQEMVLVRYLRIRSRCTDVVLNFYSVGFEAESGWLYMGVYRMETYDGSWRS